MAITCGRANSDQWNCADGTCRSSPLMPPTLSCASVSTAVTTVIVITKNICTKSLANTAQDPPTSATTVTTTPSTISTLSIGTSNTVDMKTPIALSDTPA